MSTMDQFRRKAEECLRKASELSDRSRSRLLLVKADFYLKIAEDMEAQQLSARAGLPPRDDLREGPHVMRGGNDKDKLSPTTRQ